VAQTPEIEKLHRLMSSRRTPESAVRSDFSQGLFARTDSAISAVACSSIAGTACK